MINYPGSYAMDCIKLQLLVGRYTARRVIQFIQKRKVVQN